MRLEYLGFELSIEALDGGYRARVVSAPGGHAAVSDFTLPFSDVELENLVLKLSQTARSIRGLDSPAANAAKVLGGGLFESVFTGQMAICLSASLAFARAQGKGLRLRLRLHSADLMNLPWELLYRSDLKQFIGLATRTPIIRGIDIPDPIEPLTISPPLKIIAVVSQPAGLAVLDTERELKALEHGLREPIRRSLVQLKVLPTADLNALRRELKNEYHVLHFIGHGVFDPQTQDGVILFESDAGRAVAITGQQLGTILRNHESLRLVVLNSCEGARTARDDPFAGMAQSLLQAGLPAVIGMQFEISDRAALTFAGEFYTALADGYPVDTALVESRTAVFSNVPGIEWATPVLYMRSPEGNLFDFAQASAQSSTKAIRIALASAASVVLLILGFLLIRGRSQPTGRPDIPVRIRTVAPSPPAIAVQTAHSFLEPTATPTRAASRHSANVATSDSGTQGTRPTSATALLIVSIENEAGKPLADVRVVVTGPGTERAATTDHESGRAQFKLKPGAYQLTATRAGFSDAAKVYIIAETGVENYTTIRLKTNPAAKEQPLRVGGEVGAPTPVSPTPAQRVVGLMSAAVVAEVLAGYFPAKNRRDDDHYSELVSDLEAVGVRTTQEFRALLEKHAAAALRYDREYVQHKLQSGDYPATSRERLQKGVYFSHVGLAREVLELEFGPNWRNKRTR